MSDQPETTPDIAAGTAEPPRRSAPARRSSGSSTSSSPSDQLKLTPGRIAGFAVILGALIAVFHSFFWRQINFARFEQADWGHTVVIPFIAGYFVWMRRHDLQRIGLRTTWLGFVPIILGIGLYTLTTFGPGPLVHHNFHGISVGITMSGLVLLFAGPRAFFLILWFPLLYLVVFGQSISNRLMEIVTEQMQDIAARGSEVIIALTGLDVERTGNTLYLYEDHTPEPIPLNIAEACSGMRMLMAFLALGVAMAYTGLKRNWQRALLILMAFPTAIFVNMLRVTTLAWLSRFDTEFAVGDFHTFIGLIWLVPAYVIYLGFRTVIRKLVVDGPKTGKKNEAPPARPLFDRGARKAVVAVGVIFLASGIGFAAAVEALNVHLHKDPLDLRRPFGSIPATLGPWRTVGQDLILGEATVESLGTDDYLSRSYIHEDNSDVVVRFHLAYYSGGLDPIPHVPDRCFEAGGLIQLTNPREFPLPVNAGMWPPDPNSHHHRLEQPYPVARLAPRGNEGLRWVDMPIGDYEIRVSTFRDRNEPDKVVYGGYFFVANGGLTPTPLEVKTLAFNPRENYAYYCKVQFTVVAEDDMDAFLEVAADLTERILPEVMWCLPDWREAELEMYGPETDDASGSAEQEQARREWLPSEYAARRH